MKPIVGVMPLWDDEKDSLWMLPGYLDGLQEAGALPLVFPFTRDRAEIGQLASLCAGFLLTGGQDVSPALYHQTPLAGLTECCPKRDEMETLVLEEALRTDKPVLGICRGLQFLNVFLGGTLYQDLPSQHPSSVVHRQRAPYDRPAHPVALVPFSPLQKCLGTETLPVNSCHHQAVRDLASGLEAMAFSPDGLAEAFWRPQSRFLWAVQWHPEFSFRTDPNSLRIFRAFVSALR